MNTLEFFDDTNIEDYLVRKDIRGNEFVELLDLCFSHCNYFTLTINMWIWDGYSLEMNDFLDEFQPYFVKQIVRQHWFCNYGFGSFVKKKDDVSERQAYIVNIYHAHDETKSKLLKYFSSLFLENENSDGKMVLNFDLPQDLCFFMNNKLLLGTVSHESICFLYPPNKKIEEQFLRFNSWKIAQYSAAEDIALGVPEKNLHTLALVPSDNSENGGSDIFGDNFKKLLDICFEYADYFTFLYGCKKPSDQPDAYLDKLPSETFLNALKPYFHKQIQRMQWYHRYTILEFKPGVYYEINVYHANKKAKDVLLDYFDDLFLQQKQSDGSIKKNEELAQDLCFFSKDRLLLGTVSKKMLCNVYTRDQEIYEAFMALGMWQETEYMASEDIRLDMEE